MTPDSHHIQVICTYGQGQHILLTEGRKVKVKVTKVMSVFLSFLRYFANSSYSFHRRVLKTYTKVLSDQTQKRNAAEF